MNTETGHRTPPLPGSGHWALAQYTTDDQPRPRLGVLTDGRILAAPTSWPSTLMELVAQWRPLEDELHHLNLAELSEVPAANLAAPLTYPAKVICAGANYYDHAEEMGTQRPDPTQPPFFFLKPPTTTIVGPGAQITVQGIPEAKVDWEAELAVVIADRCSAVPVGEARAHIAGYLVANDISARGRFPRPAAVFPPFQWDWVGHKGGDGFCPIGPGLVPAWQIDYPQNLSIRLSVNGVVKQDSSTRLMVVEIDALVAAASHLMTLEPGDVILTGTPAGVGMPKNTFLSSGDVMAVDIENVGHLENTIMEAGE